MSNDNNLLKPFRMPSPMDYFQEKAGEFFKQHQQKQQEKIQVNEQEKEPMNMQQLYTEFDIKLINWKANHKVEVCFNSGIQCNFEYNPKETRLSADCTTITEQNKIDAVAEVLERNRYDIAANAAQYQTAKAAYNRKMMAVNERLDSLKEMGCKKLDMQHLPRVGKMFIKGLMSDGSTIPFYAEYNISKQPADYEEEFIKYLSDNVELWREPVVDQNALAPNKLREIGDLPRSTFIIK